MKKILVIIITLSACFTCFGEATNVLPEITIKTLDINIPPKEKKALFGIFVTKHADPDKYLWEILQQVENISEFSSITTDNWQTKHHELTLKLAEKADTQGLDSSSLSECINSIYNPTNRVAELPIAAFSVKYNKKNAWVICYVWEYANTFDQDGKKMITSLGHIRAYLFDEKRRKEISMATCM